MTEDDGFRGGGGSRQVERRQKGPRSRRPFGPVPRRAGTGGPQSTPPPPVSPGGERARSPLLRPWLTLSFCLSLQWKSRWLVLRKPSPVAGKKGGPVVCAWGGRGAPHSPARPWGERRFGAPGAGSLRGCLPSGLGAAGDRPRRGSPQAVAAFPASVFNQGKGGRNYLATDPAAAAGAPRSVTGRGAEGLRRSLRRRAGGPERLGAAFSSAGAVVGPPSPPRGAVGNPGCKAEIPGPGHGVAFVRRAGGRARPRGEGFGWFRVSLTKPNGKGDLPRHSYLVLVPL